MARTPETVEFGDVQLTSRPLPYQKAEDILPDVLHVVSTVIQTGMAAGVLGRLAEIKEKVDVKQLLPLLAPVMKTLSEELGDGKLKRLAPLVLASTTVEMTDLGKGERVKLELSNSKDRAVVFDEHPELYLVALFFAGKVTFARFFSVKDLLGRTTSAE